MSTEFAFEDFFTEDNSNEMTIIGVTVISHTTLSAHESAVCEEDICVFYAENIVLV